MVESGRREGPRGEPEVMHGTRKGEREQGTEGTWERSFRTSHERTDTVRFHSYEKARIGECPETEDRLVVAGDWGEAAANRYGISFI